MKDILDQMEEHIAAIRNLQRNFDFHSKRLEKLMLSLNSWHLENNQEGDVETSKNSNTASPQNCSTAVLKHRTTPKE
jgi:hypothetical protein